MKTSTQIMIFATFIMAIVVGFNELKLIDLNATPIIAKLSIGVVMTLFCIAIWVWKTKESTSEE